MHLVIFGNFRFLFHNQSLNQLVMMVSFHMKLLGSLWLEERNSLEIDIFRYSDLEVVGNTQQNENMSLLKRIHINALDDTCHLAGASGGQTLCPVLLQRHKDSEEYGDSLHMVPYWMKLNCTECQESSMVLAFLKFRLPL